LSTQKSFFLSFNLNFAFLYGFVCFGQTFLNQISFYYTTNPFLVFLSLVDPEKNNFLEIVDAVGVIWSVPCLPLFAAFSFIFSSSSLIFGLFLVLFF